MNTKVTCWCGNSETIPFSTDYVHCPNCESLVWTGKGEFQQYSLDYSEEGYYGSRYWFEHQTGELGLPDITSRSRSDLSDRCLYWLKTLFEYRLPPANVLELGSSHGGFVAMLTKCGFTASGLEINPRIVDYARQTFRVPMFSGPVEEQKIPLGSLDVITLMDVLEHLPDPLKTLQHCLKLLKPDGLIVIQTPCYDPKKTFQELNAEQHPFARMLLPLEHIHLFSEQGITKLLHQLQAPYLVFVPAYFSVHDMFIFASRVPKQTCPPQAIEEHLLSSPDGRLMLAMLDLNDRLELVNDDRAARLEIIDDQNKQINERNEQINERDEQISEMNEQINERNEQINERNEQISEMNEQINERNEQINEFENKYREIRNQNDHLLSQIHDLTQLINDLSLVIHKQDRVLKWLPHNIFRRVIRSLSTQKARRS